MSQNIVSIVFDGNNKFPQIKINNEAISRYMELSDLIYDDIFIWGEKFFPAVDDELNERYEVFLTGYPFQYNYLQGLKNRSEYCDAIRFQKVENVIDNSNRYEYAYRVNSELKLGVDIPTYNVNFNCAIPEKYQSYGLRDVTFNQTESNYYIGNDGDDFFGNRSKYIISVSNGYGCEKEADTIVIHVPGEGLQDLVDYLNLFHYRLDFISKVFQTLKNYDLSKEQCAEFEAYLNEKVCVYVENIPSSLDCGQTAYFKYKVFPPCIEAPKLFVSCDDDLIVSYENGMLIARSEGETSVRLIDFKGNEYFSSRIKVIKHNYVENISIIAPKTNLQINDQADFRVIFTPSDAEDIPQVKYKISDENVAVLSDKNVIYALADGNFRLTVSTERVSKSVDFTVMPKISDLLVSSDTIMMYLDTDASVSCSVLPSNVSPKPSVTWTSSNSGIIQIKSASGYDCILHCRGLGSSTVICQIDGTDISKTINVTTPQPKKGCFVATAVYGSYDCPEVWVLRRYRDEQLSNHFGGRVFIKIYYAVSPKVVKLFGKSKRFNHFCKLKLDKFVAKLQKEGIDNTPYQD